MSYYTNSHFIHKQPDYCYPPPVLSDHDVIKKIENRIKNRLKIKKKTQKNITLSEASNRMRILLSNLKEMKILEGKLSMNMGISNSEWNTSIEKLNKLKMEVERLSMEFSANCLKDLKEVLLKRQSKREQLKKVKARRQHEIKNRDMISKRIDENLKKMQAEVNKTNKSENADNILSSVTRKKNEAKRSEILLENIRKLRQAREKTAAGRGQTYANGATLYQNIDKLLAMWRSRQQVYEKEEQLLKEKLRKNKECNQETDVKLLCDVTFGGPNLVPQRDFKGNVEAFIRVRAEWDQYINSNGDSLPIGWILPENDKLHIEHNQ